MSPKLTRQAQHQEQGKLNRRLIAEALWQAKLDKNKPDLTLPQKAVLQNLLLHCWHGDPVCWPFQKTIAKGTGLGLRTVNDAIDRLEKLGLFTTEKYEHNCSIYYFHVERCHLWARKRLKKEICDAEYK